MKRDVSIAQLREQRLLHRIERRCMDWDVHYQIFLNVVIGVFNQIYFILFQAVQNGQTICTILRFSPFVLLCSKN